MSELEGRFCSSNWSCSEVVVASSPLVASTFGGKDHYPNALVRIHFSAARVEIPTAVDL